MRIYISSQAQHVLTLDCHLEDFEHNKNVIKFNCIWQLQFAYGYLRAILKYRYIVQFEYRNMACLTKGTAVTPIAVKGI